MQRRKVHVRGRHLQVPRHAAVLAEEAAELLLLALARLARRSIRVPCAHRLVRQERGAGRRGERITERIPVYLWRVRYEIRQFCRRRAGLRRIGRARLLHGHVVSLEARTEQLDRVLRVGGRSKHEPPERAERAPVARVVRLQRQEAEEVEAQHEQHKLPERVGGHECRRHRAQAEQQERALAGRRVAPQQQVLDLLVEVGHVACGHLARDPVCVLPSLVQVEDVEPAVPLEPLRDPVRILATLHAFLHPPVKVRLVRLHVPEVRHLVRERQQERCREQVRVPQHKVDHRCCRGPRLVLPPVERAQCVGQPLPERRNDIQPLNV